MKPKWIALFVPLLVIVALIGVSGLGPALAANPGDVLISEVLYDCPAGCTETAGQCEWVELYNNTGNPISLSEWEICDNQACDALPNYTIQPGEEVVIAAVQTYFEGCGYSCGNGHIQYLGQAIGNGLSNTADVVCILDENDTIIDQMNWQEPTIGGSSKCSSSSLWNPGINDVAEGHSLLRSPITQDTDTRDDFQDSNTPNPCQTPTGVILSNLTAHSTALRGLGITMAIVLLGIVGVGSVWLGRRQR